MALQVFSAGQTLTASQMNTLQASTYNYPVSTVSGSTYTLEADDVGHILIFTSNAAPVTLTIPLGLAIANGDSIEIVYGGTGSLSITGMPAVIINSEGSLTTLTHRWSRAELTKTGENIYLLSWMTAVSEAEIVDGSVTEAKLDDEAVTVDKIGAAAVTSSKLAENLSLSGTTKIEEIVEKVVTNGTALTGTVNIDIKSGSVHYFTANTTANWIWNIRGDDSTTLDSMLTNNQAVTLALFATNGTSAHKLSSITVDGVTGAVTSRWFGGNVSPSGNADAVDCYTITLIKTATNTYTAFISQSRF
jgi:hypothetical protein